MIKIRPSLWLSLAHARQAVELRQPLEWADANNIVTLIERVVLISGERRHFISQVSDVIETILKNEDEMDVDEIQVLVAGLVMAAMELSVSEVPVDV